MANFFRNSPIFTSLSVPQQEELSLFCQQQWYSDGDIVFHQWDDAQAMYLVTSGRLEVLKDDEHIATLESGDIVGEIAFLQKWAKRNATVISRGDTQLITIIDFSIQKMFRENPELYENIKKIIEERV